MPRGQAVEWVLRIAIGVQNFDKETSSWEAPSTLVYKGGKGGWQFGVVEHIPQAELVGPGWAEVIVEPDMDDASIRDWQHNKETLPTVLF